MSRTIKAVRNEQHTQASVTTLTNSGALAAVALAEIAASLVVWEREQALATNAERRLRATHFLEQVKSVAAGITQSERDASVDVYAEELRKAGKDSNTLAVMKANYKLLINNSTLIDTAKSIKKNLSAIRAALSPQSEEDAAQAAVDAAGEKYAAALEAYEQAWERLAELKRARYARECAKQGDANLIPGKAAA